MHGTNAFNRKVLVKDLSVCMSLRLLLVVVITGAIMKNNSNKTFDLDVGLGRGKAFVMTHTVAHSFGIEG